MAEMTIRQLERICECLSLERLSKYRSLIPIKTKYSIIMPYFMIQTASTMFYSTIQIVEVCLRNKIHLAMTEFYTGRSKKISLPGKPEKWYEWVPTEPLTIQYIQKAKWDTKRNIHGRRIITGDIISRLMFGTWSSILNERPDNTDPLFFWTGIENSVFPNTNLTRQQKLQEIKWANDLRNRLFHREPIWTGKDIANIDDACEMLKKKHRRLLDILKWMSTDLYKAYALKFKYKTNFSDKLRETLKFCKSD